jgi:hypothetical protein
MNLRKQKTHTYSDFDLELRDQLKQALPAQSPAQMREARNSILANAARLRARRTRREPWRRAYNQFRRSLGLVPHQDVTMTYFARTLTHSFDFNLRMIHVVG